jgi:hypothetical protein
MQALSRATSAAPVPKSLPDNRHATADPARDVPPTAEDVAGGTGRQANGNDILVMRSHIERRITSRKSMRACLTGMSLTTNPNFRGCGLGVAG